MTLRAETEILSSTEITCFRRCQKEHYFRYGLKREKRAPKSDALTKGSAGHKALGQHHRHEPVTWDGMPPDIRALVRGYQAWWGDPDKQFECEGTDIQFQFSLESGVVIIGEFDAVGVRRDTGKRVIQEIKTTGDDISIGAPYWQKVAHCDTQVTNYLLASRAKGWGHVEVLYDVMRKPLLRLKKAETEEQFEQRCIEDIAERPDHYYQRSTIVRLEYDHESHIRDINGTVHLMQVAREMGENVPRNTDSCFKYGRPCDFWSVCALGADVWDEHFFRRRESKKREEKPEAKPAGRFEF